MARDRQAPSARDPSRSYHVLGHAAVSELGLSSSVVTLAPGNRQALAHDVTAALDGFHGGLGS